MNMQLAVKRLGWSSLATIGLVAALYLYPNPLFAYSHAYGGFQVMSDRPIDPVIDRVIGDATRRDA